MTRQDGPQPLDIPADVLTDLVETNARLIQEDNAGPRVREVEAWARRACLCTCAITGPDRCPRHRDLCEAGQ